MLAQVGLGQVVARLLAPFVFLGLVAYAVLLLLIGGGLFVAGVRCWNSRRDR